MRCLARAYAVMPFIWCLGYDIPSRSCIAPTLLDRQHSSIIGPALGGALADPCRNYPTLFKPGSIFERFPYLLPNLICTIILAGGVIIGILFLEETHSEKKDQRDVGREMAEWLLSHLRPPPKLTTPAFSKSGDANLHECQPLMEGDDPPPGYRSTETSPGPPAGRVRLENPSRAKSIGDSRASGSTTSVGRAFTKPVVINIVGYGLLA